MAKTTKRKSPPSPDSILAACLRELDWLRDARDDDSVSEATWTLRSKAVMLKGSRLPGEHRLLFEEQFLLMQKLEMAENLEAGVAAAQRDSNG